MSVTTHLKALQALELAIREGSLKAAADKLGLTPAAVGQRIRTLETYLGTDLLLRGRSGLQPTPQLERAMADLTLAFRALDRVTETLDFQRVTEIHIVADPDLSELWLMPRLTHFRDRHPHILFCINGEGDVPMRLGAPDCRITYGGDDGETLFRDVLIPVTGPDNVRRIADWDPVMRMEGLPLLHLQSQRDSEDHPGWVEWFRTFGHRREGPDRGVHYKHARVALDAVRQNVGFLVCGMALMLDDLDTGRILWPFPPDQHVVAPHPYRITVRREGLGRPQFQSFLEWLKDEAARTTVELAKRSGATL